MSARHCQGAVELWPPPTSGGRRWLGVRAGPVKLVSARLGRAARAHLVLGLGVERSRLFEARHEIGGCGGCGAKRGVLSSKLSRDWPRCEQHGASVTFLI